MTKRILFLGGTGVISAGSVALAAQRGDEVTCLNRGQSSVRPAPDGVEVVTGDLREPGMLAKLLAKREFDVVCDFLSFTPDEVRQTTDAVRGRTGQYVFISSASAYQTPVRMLPITESTTLANPFWQYSRDKIACEDYLRGLWRDEQFPVTIVRPSHTYDKTMSILGGGRPMVDRLLRGEPIIIHGDGTSLWTLTHTTDFAKGFCGLLGNTRLIGEVFHITSDEWLTWDGIARTMAAAAGVEPTIVHVTSDRIRGEHERWGDGLLGDKANCTIFDNAKIKAVVPDFVCTTPFAAGAKEIVAYFRSRTDPYGDADHDLDRAISALLE